MIFCPLGDRSYWSYWLFQYQIFCCFKKVCPLLLDNADIQLEFCMGDTIPKWNADQMSIVIKITIVSYFLVSGVISSKYLVFPNIKDTKYTSIRSSGALTKWIRFDWITLINGILASNSLLRQSQLDKKERTFICVCVCFFFSNISYLA